LVSHDNLRRNPKMAKHILVKCNNCGKKLVSDDRYVGFKGKCPSCNSVIRIARGTTGAPDGTEDQIIHFDELETRKGALLRVTKQNDIAIVTFTTSRILDQSNVQQLGEELDELLDKHQLKKLVLNFENIHYMSSAVMGKLVSLHKKLKAASGDVKLCNISPGILEIFSIMRFDRLFDIRQSEDQAVIELMET